MGESITLNLDEATIVADLGQELFELEKKERALKRYLESLQIDLIEGSDDEIATIASQLEHMKGYRVALETRLRMVKNA